ncbi:MAG TPA: hypothetical protein VGO16_12605 [Pseudonocardiaceae bacterium]|nr:hypothetical protein [Pseudonocardiaceae bacterium]
MDVACRVLDAYFASEPREFTALDVPDIGLDHGRLNITLRVSGLE